MDENWNFDKCAAVLAGEIELLKKISAAQSVVRQAVLNREWVEFDAETAEVNRLGEEFAVLEDARIRLFAALDDSGEKPFYYLLARLPETEGRELSRLYRELQMETMKMRSLNESLLIYINEAKTMTAAYIEAVCPGRGGKLYTRKGRRVLQDMSSMVFNNHF